MNNRFLTNLQLSLASLDFITINAVFFVYADVFKKELLADGLVKYFYFAFFSSLSWFTVTLATRVYNKENVLSFNSFTRKTMYAFAYFLIPVSLYLAFFHQFTISRFLIAFVLCSIPIVLLFNRFLYFIGYSYISNRDSFVNKVVIIGYNEISKKLATYLQETGVNKQVIGFFEEYNNVTENSNFPILGNIKDAVEISQQLGINEIYTTIAPEHDPIIYQLMLNADKNCIRMKIVADIGFLVNKQVHFDYLKDILLLSVRNEPLEDLGNRIKKRGFDIVVSLFVIVFILSWLVPIIGLFIWLENRGPVFFVQARSGKDNLPFPCLKFRSMKVNNASNEKQATKNDNRITKVGKFLRRTSLDEFPQFFNVFKGQMSIIGPRPHMLKHTNEYSQIVNEYMVRQFLKPGISGWAQVNGYRGETKNVEQMQKRVEYDLWYMENWNPWIDLRIIFMTIFNTIRGEENAY